MTGPDNLRVDYQNYLKKMQRSFDHPTNQMLFGAFALFRQKRQEDKDLWDCESSKWIDSIYSAGLGNSVAKSPRFKEYRENADESKKMYAIRWLHDETKWLDIFPILGQSPSPCCTRQDIENQIEKVILSADKIHGLLGYKSGYGPISFCSKYYYFLNNITPILDSHAKNSLAKIDLDYKSPSNDYQEFVTTYLNVLAIVYGEANNFSPEMIKNLDGYLYDSGRGDWKIPEDATL